ncbi:MAG: hypothetical protein KDM91_08790, partial [Verrucomicrobiae bacterium]|nr:hypothetical protein [Verrucomicrobiae bacterium]
EPDPVNLPGVTISRILAYWADTERAVIHATLRGPGVTSANDGAVLLVNPGVETRILLREGDPVCDWDCPKIASIQRVEFNRYNRRYAIVASLTGSNARNQALFAGHVVSAHPVRNLPLLRLRKGSLYQSPAGQTTRLRSIDLRPIVESTGSGANGRDQVAWTDAVLCLSFDNKVKQIATIGLLP